MRLLYRIRALARWLFRRDEIERALDTDLADYIERSAAEKMQAGMSGAEARRAARIELGGVEQTKDSVRATLSWAAIENTLADMGHAFRTLRRQKTFTAVTMLTLGLGIGVNVAIFSLAEQILLRPLPVPEPNRLVNLSDSLRPLVQMDANLLSIFRPSASGGLETTFSYPMFRDLEREQEPFAGLAAHTFFEARLATGEQARFATGVLVSGSYFSVLGLQPALGRLLGPQDDRVDGEAASVVLSHAYWQSELGGDPDVLGQTLTVNEVPLAIVGVAPPGFHGTAVSARANVFVPITISFAFSTSGVSALSAASAIPNHDRRDYYWVHLFARLKPAVTREAAAAAMNTAFRAILSDVEAPLAIGATEQELEAFRTRALVLEPGARGQTNSQVGLPARFSLMLLLAASGFVLLLCCANVAGLILLRATTRSGEMALRASLGATRKRLASLLLTESLVLALPAAVLSLPIASLILGVASRVPGMPATAADASLSVPAALVGVGVAVASAVAVGLLPVRDLIRIKPGSALQTYGARHTTTKSVARFRAALATVQVALSMALLAMVGVFAQSLANITRLDLGVDINSVVMFSVSPANNAISTDVSTLLPLAEALEAIPGVSSVAWTNSRPVLSLQGAVIYQATVDGAPAEIPASIEMVSPDFFRTFGIELLAGRDFNDIDNPRGVIVNRRFAERFGLAPDGIVGRTARPAPFAFEIVGVVDDLRLGRVTDAVEPLLFMRASPGRVMIGPATFYVRSARPTDELVNAIRETISRVDPTRPIANLQTMEQQFRESTAVVRFFTGTATVFALLATALAALGLYGVLAYSVAQRSREMGLRFALGAPAGRIRAMVLRQVAGMAVIGVALGMGVSWLLGRAASGFLFGVEAGDPLALGAAATVLAAVMLGAAYLPARRASRVDPMTVLRYE
jgi:putative ABC transport system permease protein